MVEFGTSVTFTKKDQPAVELHNFWPPEDGFVWSGGRWSEVIFGLASEGGAGQCELVMDFDVFKHPPEVESQNIFVYLNGLRIGSRLVSKRVTAFLEFPSSVLRQADNVLTFDTPDSAKPSAFGGGDNRLLGAQLFSFEIRNVEPI